MPRFGRVLTAMITPFTLEGDLDLEGAKILAEWLVENGSDGIVVAGTTGESPTLTQREQFDLVAAVVQAVNAPVIAGAGSNNTEVAIENSKMAVEAGAAGLLQVAGYYNRPSQAGLEAHFKACAEATDLPNILYDIPARTGRKIETETMLKLAREVPNIVAVKDAAGSPGETSYLISQAPTGFEVYSGDDALTLSLLAVGAVGVIGVATHWVGREMGEMISAYVSGDVDGAAEINQRMIPSYRFESSDAAPNPVPTKCVMRVLGLPGGECRLPMGPEPSWLEAEARLVLGGVDKI